MIERLRPVPKAWGRRESVRGNIRTPPYDASVVVRKAELDDRIRRRQDDLGRHVRIDRRVSVSLFLCSSNRPGDHLQYSLSIVEERLPDARLIGHRNAPLKPYGGVWRRGRWDRSPSISASRSWCCRCSRNPARPTPLRPSSSNFSTTRAKWSRRPTRPDGASLARVFPISSHSFAERGRPTRPPWSSSARWPAGRAHRVLEEVVEGLVHLAGHPPGPGVAQVGVVPEGLVRLAAPPEAPFTVIESPRTRDPDADRVQ